MMRLSARPLRKCQKLVDSRLCISMNFMMCIKNKILANYNKQQMTKVVFNEKQVKTGRRSSRTVKWEVYFLLQGIEKMLKYNTYTSVTAMSADLGIPDATLRKIIYEDSYRTKKYKDVVDHIVIVRKSYEKKK